jgi:nucleotide-binding universal stress UspA family protein
LLVPVDLSPLSDRVVDRVALLPLAEACQITLLHVVPDGLAPAARRAAERDAHRALKDEARSLQKRLPSDAKVDCLVTVGSAASDIAERAAALKVGLIVMGRGERRALRDAFLGSTAERVVRRALLPVLVVRRAARSAYRRPALALDTDEAAQEAVNQLLRIVPAPRPTVTVIHAFSAPYEGLIYPSLSEDQAQEHRRHFQQQAARELSALLADALARARVTSPEAPRWAKHVHHGTPVRVIEKVIEKADTDLLALGTHGYSGLAHLFLGTVAGDVLREVSCDVLVAPPRPERSAN